MTSLRQRLLLVAGWAVAAVATGLVSAGAVAVAGGQVNDRPLRPLSAAEVAALPVTAEDPCSTSERLASGDSASLTGCLDRSSSSGPTTPGDDTARPAEKETVDSAAIDAANADMVAPSDDPNTEIPENAEAPLLGPQTTESSVVDVTGGRVSVGVVGESLVLKGATPRPGFVVDLLFESPEQLRVTFWNGSHLSTVIASITPQGLEVTPTEDPG